MRRRDDNSTSRTGRLEGKSPPKKKLANPPNGEERYNSYLIQKKHLLVDIVWRIEYALFKKSYLTSDRMTFVLPKTLECTMLSYKQ